MTTFDDFDLKEKLLRGIYSYGFENPSDIQCKALPILNLKKDLKIRMGVLPTTIGWMPLSFVIRYLP